MRYLRIKCSTRRITRFARMICAKQTVCFKKCLTLTLRQAGRCMREVAVGTQRQRTVQDSGVREARGSYGAGAASLRSAGIAQAEAAFAEWLPALQRARF